MAVPIGVGNAGLRQLIDNAGVEAVGEVQATPTAYTLLRRLKDIADAVVTGAVAVDAQEMGSFTVSSVVKAVASDFGFSAPALAAATIALVSVLNGGMMYTLEGTAPTTVVGHLLPAGATISVTGNTDINNLQFIRQAAVDGEVTVTLFY